MKIICLATNKIGDVHDSIAMDDELLKNMGYARHSISETPEFITASDTTIEIKTKKPRRKKC